MASKQKSFFDQSHSNKPRWQYRKRPFQSNPPPFPVPNPPTVKPAIPASIQSRSKLSAFRFDAATSKVQDRMPSSHVAFAEKENLFPIQPQVGIQNVGADQTKRTKDLTREFPSTPAGRISLADLMGDNEDEEDNAPKRTPLETVAWDQAPRSSNESSSCMTPIMRRGKKRPRSSPQSSSQKALAAKTVFDPNAPFKTPQNDPAIDLENRYFGRGKHQTPSKPSSSAAPDFMHSSSPSTPVSASTESAKLRRTVSCGIAYPSGHKRRKICIDTFTEPKKGLKTQFTSIERQGELEKINLLLDSIHDDLPGSSRSPQPSDPTSSCPLPGERESQRRRAPSPRVEESHIVDLQRRSLHGCQTDDPVLSQHREPPQEPESSEFGDVDADLALADADGANMLSPRQESRDRLSNQRESDRSGCEVRRKDDSGQATRKGKDEESDPIVSLHLSQSAEQKLCLNQGLNDNDDDELDDFAADLELVASMYDQQPTNTSAKNEMSHETHETNATVELPIQPELSNIQAPQNEKLVLDISSDEEFGDDDFEEIANEIERATQAGQPLSSKIKPEATIPRYVIMSVTESMYEKDGRSARPEKVLHVQEERTKQHKIVSLRDAWIDSPCAPGATVHVLGNFDNAGQCVVDDGRHFLIINPDNLISATVVADSFSCTRRAILQDRVKATSAANEPQVYGHILHEVFQEALNANRWDTEWLEQTIETICIRYLETLYEINVEVRLAVDHLMCKVPEMQSWAKLFVSARPKPQAVVQDRNGSTALMSINKLLDVEEHVWSPKYGLKGNIDATVQVAMQDRGDERTLTVPFEVKTGRNNSSISHKAQTALYTLLLSDRYDIQIAYGILYYTETSEISRISGVRREIVGMVKQRNVLACYVRNRAELPPMLQDQRMCGKCYAQRACFTYHRLTENGDGKTSGLKGVFTEAVKHLQPTHQDFFKKWDDLLTKEETDVLRFRKELWTMLSSERERVGRCFGGLIIQPGSGEESADAPKINRFKYTFVKQKDAPSFSFTDSQLTTGEPIVISDEAGHYALANGYVTNVRKNRVTVTVDRRLHNARVRSDNFDAERYQSFTGIMEIVEAGKAQQTLTPHEPAEAVVYRLDKDEFSNGMATVRNNLIRLMDDSIFGMSNLRQLIVEGKSPAFETCTAKSKDWMSASQASLNIDQKNAIEKVMSAKNYALVLGMPGTGKTTTIAHIIRALAARGKSVLLTSYTHTAVDNILLKIRNDNIGILRLGALAKIHPEVQGFADLASAPKSSFQELETSYSRQVVATTCLGINHPIFHARIFDYCIVDEASQITLPVCLGPIGLAKKFVLVGDHYQLPPLVQNKEAASGGLDVSLFKLLSDTHPSSVVNLEHQYRMCADIMSLSNTLIYSGRLKCGTEAVASRIISIPDLPALKSHHHQSPSTLAPGQTSFCLGPSQGRCWLADALSPSARVVFLNTDPLGTTSREIAKGSRITNSLEVALTTQLVVSLLTTGIPASDIGVITLYRSQLALLKHSLRRHTTRTTTSAGAKSGAGGAGEVEAHTADKFQGRDKEAVILSLVRSNESNSIGDLLADWRRVNVALTRARTKLIIIGSLGTISRGSELLGQFTALCKERGWVRDLKVGDGEGHWFEEVNTQTQGLSGLLPALEAVAKVETKETVRGSEKGGWDDEDEENKPESDMEVGARGKSPTKSSQSRSPLKSQKLGQSQSRGSGKGKGFGLPLSGNAKGGVKKERVPEKRGTTNYAKVLKRRPVMRDVLSEMTG